MAVAGCGLFRHAMPEELVRSGEARRQLVERVDGTRQCAVLWVAAPVDISGYDVGTDDVKALVAAGLFRLQPLAGPDPCDREFTMVPTVEGSKHVVMSRLGAPVPLLCVGRRRVASVTTTPPAFAELCAQSSRIHYTYRVVDMRAWTRRGDVRRAYPFLRRIGREELTPVLPASLSKGRLDPQIAEQSVPMKLTGMDFTPRDAR